MHSCTKDPMHFACTVKSAVMLTGGFDAAYQQDAVCPPPSTWNLTALMLLHSALSAETQIVIS